MLQGTFLSSLTKVFLDEAPNAGRFVGISLLQGEYGAFQVALHSEKEMHLDFTVQSDLKIHVFEVCSVPVTRPCFPEGTDDFYLRKTPGLYPDLLRPCESIRVDTSFRALWFEIEKGNYTPGDHTVTVSFCENGQQVLSLSTTVHILDAVLPKQSLICTHWFHTDCLHTYYQVPVFSEAYWRITENFVRTAVEHGVNFLLTPLFTPPLDTAVGKERPTVQLVDVTVEDGEYSFSFDNLRRWISMCLRCGVEYFELSHLFTQWGAMHAPKIMATVDGKYKQIFGWKTWAASQKYTAFLRAFAPKLDAFLEETGVKERCFFHVSDEPNMSRIKEYGARSALIHELFPDYPVIDALSDFAFYQKGILKKPIPCIDSVSEFVGNVPELWTYYCCGPGRGNYPNRFMSMPSVRSRILGFLMYKYDVKGFLQWGLNFYYSQYSDHPIDPFQVTDADDAFPAGDPFVLYPGEDGTALVSLRFKVFREAIQDQLALQVLESRIGREKTMALLEGDSAITWNTYPHDADWLLECRARINRAIEETAVNAL